MPLRLLCLHGWGTSIKILQSQLGPLMSDLRRDNTATFHFLEGECDSDPGPGIAGYFDGPYYSYYKFPRSFSDNDDSDVLDAYDQLYTVIEEEGPFDGILGFSHGGTLAAGFLIQHAERFPHDPPLVRCAIFINSLPPFRMNPGEKPVIDMGLDGYLSLPTVSIAGAQDSLLEYSRALHELCSPTSAWVVHSKGHDIPGDRTNVARMAAAIRKLAVLVSLTTG